MSPGRLYLVPTPIGNLEDITLRALRILKEVDWIACEDTRQTAKLLNHFAIRKKCVSFYKPKEAEQAGRIISAIQEGNRIALVSDAGSPALSDPGELLVSRALAAGLEIEALPGATALIPALTGSGFPTAPFVFFGFPPRRIRPLQDLLAPLSSFRGTLVFYESPNRVAGLCAMLQQLLGDLPAAAVKEISKIHEKCSRGTLLDLHKRLSEEEQRGEWVLMVHKADPGSGEEIRLESIDDLYQYFKDRHNLSKNHVRKIIQTRKNG